MRRVIILVVVAVALTSACGSKRSGGIDAVRAASERGSISPVGQDLLDLLNRGRTLTYHATYTVKTDDPQMSSGNFVVDLWRKAPMVREDTTNNLQGGTARSAEILGADGVRVHCEKPGNDAWTCSRVSSTVKDGFDDLVGTATAQLQGAIVTPSTQKTNGRTDQCFTIKPIGDVATIACVTSDGIVTRLNAGGSGLELTNLQMNAKDSDFVAPGPVS